ERGSWDRLAGERWCVAAATPGAVYRLVSKRWGSQSLFGHDLFTCLVLDEASQMSLPEAAMAALPLAPDGQLIVVGDHRQLPPIVDHSRDTEPRRHFQERRTYQPRLPAQPAPNPPVGTYRQPVRPHRGVT